MQSLNMFLKIVTPGKASSAVNADLFLLVVDGGDVSHQVPAFREGGPT